MTSAQILNLEECRDNAMTSPQIEDGYTRIANELLDAILAFGFSGRQLALIFALIRKTYGYNKKSDEISLRQFEDLTGIARRHVCVAIHELVELNVFKIHEGKYANNIGINKNYSQWGVPKSGTGVPNLGVPKSGTGVPNLGVPKSGTGCSQIGNRSVPKSGTEVFPNREQQKTSTKDNKKTNPKEKEISGISEVEKLNSVPGKNEIPSPDFGGDEVQKSWADYVEHRRAIKKPLTPLSAKKNLDMLRKADADGYDAAELCDKTVRNGWQGIFAPKPGDKRKDSRTANRQVGGLSGRQVV